MTDKKPLKNPVFVDLCTRLNLTDAQCAEYLGVPLPTFRKWMNGDRAPSAAVHRLIVVLGVIEALAPDLHKSFIPEKNAHVEKVLMKTKPTLEKSQ